MKHYLTISEAAQEHGLQRADIRFLIRHNLIHAARDYCGRFWTTRRRPLVCVSASALSDFLRNRLDPFTGNRGDYPLPPMFPMTDVRWG